MRIERAAREADVRRLVVAVALHPLRTATDDSDRKAAAERLAVGHKVCVDAEVLLCATHRETEAEEHFVEDQHDAARRAHGTQSLEPLRVGSLVEAHRSLAVDEHRVRRRVAVRVHGLQRIDQDASDVVAGAKHFERLLRHVRKRVDLTRGPRVADACLHTVPPTVVGATEAHDVRLAGVVARESHGLHHRLGAGHVEGHLVLLRDALQASDVVGDDGVIRPENRPE